MRAVICILLLVSLYSTAHAHPGRTDASGGHYNRKTGSYHYHGGGPATTPKASSTPPAPKASSGPSLAGVASVIDGDTIEIHGQRIRLHGIDAPESSQTCKVDGEPWRCGKDAAFKLADKIGKQTVTCEQKDVDRYGRVVAVCSAGGEDLNGWMVSEGLAVAYRQYSKDYVGQEEQAKTAGIGVWGSEFEMPWDYRKKK
jgi:endonuclease YncB( thermonuclease family)